MKHIFLLLLAIILFSCDKQFTVEEDIEDIVNVVAADTSYIYETTSPLSPVLVKKQANNQILSSNVRISFLMNLKEGNKKIFSSEDSVYFFQQNNTLKNFRLKKQHYGNLVVKNVKDTFNYKFSIPIFSKQHDYAFIQADHVWPYVAGTGYGFILKKTSGKWKIIIKELRWES